MHVSFICILLPRFLTDSLVNIIIFKVGHLFVRLGTLGACVRDYFWHLWVGESCRCLGNNGWLTFIAVGYPKIPLQLLNHPAELVRGSCTKVKDITL